MQYGLQSDNLDITSPFPASLNDFDATNHQLIIGASGLIPNTTYYYRIQANNTVGTTNSAVMSVTTLPARESHTHKLAMCTFCAFACTHTQVYMRTCVYVEIHTCTLCVCVHACMHVCVYTCICVTVHASACAIQIYLGKHFPHSQNVF